MLAEARALLALPDHPVRVVVDLGAGRGELATHLIAALEHSGSRYAVAPPRDESPRPRVVAVDVVDRPEGLDEHVEWLRSPGGAGLPPELTDLRDALVVAHEWLDVVPCTVAEVDADGTPREVLVDPTSGEECLGGSLTAADRRWVDTHWPTTRPGDRIEVGRARDEAWSDLVSRVASGTLVAVDYGHTATTRPSGGTLTAYARGQLPRRCPTARATSRPTSRWTPSTRTSCAPSERRCRPSG